VLLNRNGSGHTILYDKSEMHFAINDLLIDWKMPESAIVLQS
jgi:hypothetical protein